MKLDIYSLDRIGITQEILAVLVQHGWNLLAMEVQQFHTFVSLSATKRHSSHIVDELQLIDGVMAVTQIFQLPSEQRRQHLDTLLTRLPDPILDIDITGTILIANKAALITLNQGRIFDSGQRIQEFVPFSLESLLKLDGFSDEIITAKGAYLLESWPVKSDKQVSGAVISLKSVQRVAQQISAVRTQSSSGVESIIGNSTRMKTVRQQTLRFANLDLPVLIRGETGTGKELLARALHDSSTRKKAPFLAINCATLAENLLESELFGYANGAFSGAQKGGKPGLFELANNGTIFLDEIGEMSTYLQAKLLRFLEDYSFRRIGGTREIVVNIRIVCATHRDLEKMTQTGEFREDLFYRLNVLNLQLPSLKERKEDLDILVPHFVKRACEQVDQPLMELSERAMNKIRRADWPGNIRQLQNTIFRAVALNDSSIIDNLDLQVEDFLNPIHSNYQSEIVSLTQAISDYEKNILTQLYQQYPSTRKLANRLSVSHAQIARKLKHYKIA